QVAAQGLPDQLALPRRQVEEGAVAVGTVGARGGAAGGAAEGAFAGAFAMVVGVNLGELLGLAGALALAVFALTVFALTVFALAHAVGFASGHALWTFLAGLGSLCERCGRLPGLGLGLAHAGQGGV